MRHSRLVRTSHQLLEDDDPIVSAATLMVHVHRSGRAHAVMGRMDLTSRRYVFDQSEDLSDVAYTARETEAAVAHAASLYLRQSAARRRW